MSDPMPPWHMWGTTVRIASIAGSQNSFVSQQVARVNYRRPETWSFFIGAKIVGGQSAATGGIVRIRVNFLFGVGRSVVDSKQNPDSILSVGATRDAFALFTWDLSTLGTASPARIHYANKYTTSVATPPMIDLEEDSRKIIEWIPAQDIQVEAELNHAKVDPEDTVIVEVATYFAPRTHHRPEWHSPTLSERFPGAEKGGT